MRTRRTVGLVVLAGVALWASTASSQVTPIRPAKSTGQGTPADQVEPTRVTELFWGDGPLDVARRGGDEAAAEGPASFAVSRSGELFVLDQAHGRVLRFDPNGEPLGSFDAGSDTFQDMDVTPDEQLVLLDRLVGSLLRVVDAETGEALGHYALTGKNLAEGGLTTALLANDDGVWVELEHTRSVRLLDRNLVADTQRTVVNGRALPSVKSTVIAALYGPRIVSFTVVGRDGTAARLERVVNFEWEVDHIATIDELPDGRWLVAAVTQRLEAAGEEPVDPASVERRTEFVLLEPGKVEVTRVVGPASLLPWEQFREVRLGGDGDVYQMVFTRTGAEVLRWTF